MIKTERINGFEVQYMAVNPSRLDLKFKIGSSVKQLGVGYEAAINFPYADIDTGTPIGRVIVNGVTVISDVEKTKNRDLFYVTQSGAACIGPYPTTSVQWAVQGSPRLLRGGKNVVKESITRDHTPSDIALRSVLRTAVGLKRDGSVVLLASNSLLYLDELAAIMSKLGCIDALNGDGGGSSYLWPEDTGWGRALGAAIVVKKEAPMPTVNKRIGVIVDGKLVGDGLLVDGVSYVPARLVAESLGCTVGYDGKNVTVITKGGQ